MISLPFVNKLFNTSELYNDFFDIATSSDEDVWLSFVELWLMDRCPEIKSVTLRFDSNYFTWIDVELHDPTDEIWWTLKYR